MLGKAVKRIFIDDSLDKLIAKYSQEFDWKKPPADWNEDELRIARSFRNELIGDFIPSTFSLEGYHKLGHKFEKYLAAFFNIPKAPWDFEAEFDPGFAHLIDGAEKIKPYLGDVSIKPVFLVAPHNSHSDEILVPSILKLNGLGDVRTSARSNMFKFKWLGKHLKTGAYTGAFIEKMEKSMILEADRAVQEFLEERLIPKANDGYTNGGTHQPIYGNPLLYVANGRSVSGKFPALSNGIVKYYVELQLKHPEYIFKIFPISNTMLSAPEQDAFPDLPRMKALAAAGNPMPYFWLDYGNILKKFARSRFIGGRPKSDVFYQVGNPIDLSERLEGNEDKPAQVALQINQELRKYLMDAYAIMPEKLLAYVMTRDMIPINDEVSPDLSRELMKRRYFELQEKGKTLLWPSSDVNDGIEKAIEFYRKDGTINTGWNNIKFVKRHRLDYQANTIEHHLK